MAQSAKAIFSPASYAAFRPAYPAALYETLITYHTGSKSLCVDLGTGHGLVARALSAWFHVVLGTDPSPGMIQQARSLTPKEQFANVNFEEASAERMPFQHDSSVDMIVAAQAAHWFDQAKLFPEMERIVRKGGTLAFWGYGDHVFVEFPRATKILRHYTHGRDSDLLGSYWPQPGRSVVQNKLRAIQPPSEGWDNVRRIEYEPGSEGARSGTGTMFLYKRLTLRDCMNYIRTWSSFNAWQKVHPTAQSREAGGRGDVVDEMFDRMRSAEPDWQSNGWEEIEIEIEWPTGLLLAKKR